MKYLAILSLLMLFAFGCFHNETTTRLLTDQKLLKDSASNISARIGYYIRKGSSDSAEAQKKQLGAVFARLAEIQASLDSRSKEK